MKEDKKLTPAQHSRVLVSIIVDNHSNMSAKGTRRHNCPLLQHLGHEELFG